MLAWILRALDELERRHGDVESVFSKDDLLTHATIYWVGNAIGTSIRTYANNNRYPWTPSHDRTAGDRGPDRHHLRRLREPARRRTTEERVAELPRPATAPPGTTTSTSPPTDDGGHFIPWEVPDEWVDDLRRTFRTRR